MASTQIFEPGYQYFTGVKATIPAYAAQSGTVGVTSGSVTVIGTGTSFLSEYEVGDYIYIDDSHEVRRVKAVFSDLRLDVERAFATTHASDPSNRVRPKLTGLKEISVSSVGTADAVLSTVKFDNQLFVAGLSQGWGSDVGIGVIAVDTTTALSAVAVNTKS